MPTYIARKVEERPGSVVLEVIHDETVVNLKGGEEFYTVQTTVGLFGEDRKEDA